MQPAVRFSARASYDQERDIVVPGRLAHECLDGFEKLVRDLGGGAPSSPAEAAQQPLVAEESATLIQGLGHAVRVQARVPGNEGGETVLQAPLDLRVDRLRLLCLDSYAMGSPRPKNDVLQGGTSGQDSSRGNPFPQSAVQEFRVTVGGQSFFMT